MTMVQLELEFIFFAKTDIILRYSGCRASSIREQLGAACLRLKSRKPPACQYRDAIFLKEDRQHQQRSVVPIPAAPQNRSPRWASSVHPHVIASHTLTQLPQDPLRFAEARNFLRRDSELAWN
jgi:hypothetical protein